MDVNPAFFKPPEVVIHHEREAFERPPARLEQERDVGPLADARVLDDEVRVVIDEAARERIRIDEDGRERDDQEERHRAATAGPASGRDRPGARALLRWRLAGGR